MNKVTADPSVEETSQVETEETQVTQEEEQQAEAVEEQASEVETSEETAEQPEEENEVTKEEPEAVAEGETEADEEEEAEEVDPIVELQEQLKEQEEKYMRLLAEFENFKRRSIQENQTRLKFAAQPLATEIIPGLDNLERALAQAKDEENEQLLEFVKGIEMVQQNFYDALKKSKIERVDPKGEPFDPNHHEAVGIVQTDEVQPDHVAQVFQAGYTLHDRVIRPAMVQVAKKK